MILGIYQDSIKDILSQPMPPLKSKSTPQLKKKAIEVFNAWIVVSVAKDVDYTFTCTVCKYTETRLQRTKRSGKTLENRFRKAHEKCG